MIPPLSITFPQEFWIFKIFGHPTLGTGDKNTFKQYLPEGQCFEKTHTWAQDDDQDQDNNNNGNDKDKNSK